MAQVHMAFPFHLEKPQHVPDGSPILRTTEVRPASLCPPSRGAWGALPWGSAWAIC